MIIFKVKKNLKKKKSIFILNDNYFDRKINIFVFYSLYKGKVALHTRR